MPVRVQGAQEGIQTTNNEKDTLSSVFDLGSGEWIRTTDLRVMSPTSCHCSTPHQVRQ
jgi:hypothetical protein